MKRFQRMTAVFLSLVILLGTVPAGVFATEGDPIESPPIPFTQPEILTVGVKKTLSLTQGETKEVTFTPEESGTYFFTSESEEDTYATLFEGDEELTSSDDNGIDYNFGIQQSLEAGKTYTLHVSFLSDEIADDMVIFVEKRNAPTEIEFHHDALKKVAEGITDYELSVRFLGENPWNEPLLTETGNSEILRYSYCDEEYAEQRTTLYFDALAAGTTTVTATSPLDGSLTASTSVTVVPAVPVTPDLTARHTASCDTFGYSMVFTLAEKTTVRPVLSTDGANSFSYNCEIANAESGESYGYGQDGQYVLEAGTYFCTLDFNDPLTQNVSFDFVLLTLVPATSISITSGNFSGMVGSDYWLEYQFLPENAVTEKVTVTSDNPQVAAVDEESSRIRLLAAGTANITVTSESGLSNTVTMTVTEAPEAEALYFDYDTINGYVGIPMDLYVNLFPDGALREGLSWSVSDPAVAVIRESNHYTARIDFSATGTVTVTATMAGGLSASCTVTVKNAPQLTVSTPAEVTIANDQRELVLFTAEQSGWYRISTTDAAAEDLSLEVYDEALDYLAWSGDTPSVDCYFEAGETYFVYLDLDTFSTTFTLRADALVPMTSFSLSPDPLTGAVRADAVLKAIFSPEGAARESVSYQSSDPEIASVESMGSCDARVYFHKTGTVTVTATAQSGKTATATVTVTEPKSLALNEKETLEISDENSSSIKFVPETDGYYCFSFSNDSNFCHHLYDDAGELLFFTWGEGFETQQKLYAGKSYYLVLQSDGESGESNVTVTKLAAPTSLTFSLGDSYTNFVGTSQYLNLSFRPKGCYEEEITLVSDNPEIVQINEGSQQISLLAPGTATVTASSESGLSDTLTVTVLDIHELTFNEESEMELISANGEYVTKAVFVPEETGNYSLLFKNAKYVNYVLENSDIYGYITASEEAVNFEMEKDEEYVFTFSYDPNGNPPEFSLKMREAAAMESIELLSPPEQTEYVENFEYFDYSGLKLKGTLAGGESEIWTYSGSNDRLCGYRISIQDVWEDAYEKTVVTCGGKTVEFTFSIVQNPVERLELVRGTEVTYLENCNGYKQGNWFYYHTQPPADAMVKVIYKNGTEKTVGFGELVDMNYCLEWDSYQYETHWKVGVNDSKIHYLGQEVTLPITVLPASVDRIEPIGNAVEIYEHSNGYEREGGSFFYYYSFLERVQIRIHKKDGSFEDVPFYAGNGDSIFEYHSDQSENPWVLGSNNYVEVSYQGVTCRIPVAIVENPVESIEILSAPTADYYYGDLNYGWMDGGSYVFDTPDQLDGLSLRIRYKSGSYEDITAADLDPYNAYRGESIEIHPVDDGPHGVGTIPVKLFYMGKSATYNVELKASPVTSLEVAELPASARETNLLYPDLRGTKIRIHDASGSRTVTFSKEDTEIEYYGGTPVFCLDVDGFRMSIGYDYELEAWAANYLGASVTLDVPYDETPTIQKTELIHFEPDIAGTKLRITFKGGSTEEITLGEIYGGDSGADYLYGLAEGEKGLYWFDWYEYADERGYGVFYFATGEFIIPLDGNDPLPGDVDGNGEVDLDDAIYLLYHVNFKDTYPVNQPVDFNGDSKEDLDDAIYLLYHVNFKDTYPLH